MDLKDIHSQDQAGPPERRWPWQAPLFLVAFLAPIFWLVGAPSVSTSGSLDLAKGRAFSTSTLTGQARVAAAGPTVLAAAGDIACDPSDENFNDGAGTRTLCKARSTAKLLANADVVLPLGDEQYWTGTLADFERSYARSWGAYLDVSRPVPGNHEYDTSMAAGYFSYFGGAAKPGSDGYYSYELRGWHVVALNSECAIVGCDASSAQYRWLERDLAAHPTACLLAYWHRPRFSSGTEGGDSAKVAPFWNLLYAAGAEVVLNGHDHDYERFAKQDPSRKPTPQGIREFVVGTGGRSLGSFGVPDPNSEVRNATTFGILELTLRDASYGWRFVGVPGGGGFSDFGSSGC